MTRAVVAAGIVGLLSNGVACAEGAAGGGLAPEGSDTTVTGALTSDPEQEGRLDGGGSLRAGTQAALFVLDDNGDLVLMSRSTINADGRFTLETLPGEGLMVVRVEDDEGVVLGQSLVARGPEAGDAGAAAVVSAESTLEAEIARAMVLAGERAEAIDVADLRLRVRAETATRVRDNDVDNSAEIRLLTNAALAAQHAEAAELTAQGVITQTRTEARAAAVAALDARAGSGDGDAVFLTEMASIDAALGLSAERTARLTMASSAAARVVVRGAQSAGVDAQTRFAMVHGGAMMEARAIGDALVTIVDDSPNVDDARLEAAATVAAELEDDVAEADSSASLVAAFTNFRLRVAGASASGVDLAGMLGLEVDAAEVSLALSAVAEAGGDLEDSVAEVEDEAASADLDTRVDVAVATSLAEDVRDAHGAFRSDVDVIVGGATNANDVEAGLLVRTLVVTEGCWR